LQLVDAYPLSMLQTGMLFHSRYGSGRSTYQDILSLELEGRPDLEVLRRALDATARRHAALRTAFDVTTFSEPMQLLYDRVEVPLAHTDLRHLTPEEQARQLDEWFEREKARELEWTRPPLAHFQVQVLSERRWRLGLTFHHAILDGWSLASLITELVQRCQAADSDAPDGDAELAVSMRDYVALEREALADPATRAFWQELLRDRPFTAIPRWPERDSGDHASTRVRLPASVGTGLQELSRELGVPLRSIVLAAHLEVLSLLSGQRDVVTGLVTHGRPEVPDGDRALGLFLNTLPLRARTVPGTWREALRRGFQAEARLIPHRRYPLARLQRDHAAAGQPLFEVAFDFRNFHVYESLPAAGATRIVGGHFFERNNFPLTVNANLGPSPSQLELNFSYDPSEFPAAQIRRIAGYYEAALGAIAHAPDSPIRHAELLSPGERHTLVATWNDTGAELPDAAVHDLVAAQARRTPDKVAVSFEDQHLTYAELEERASRLAARLRALTVERGTLVGICMDRSLELVVALLGVLKAGGAYVPLDPRYPAQRLAYMVSDADAAVMLTQERLVEQLPPTAARVLCLDSRSERESRPPAAAPVALRQSGADLAYVIYTSGSTGQPKGVMVPHRGVVNLLWSMARLTGVDDHDVVLATTSLSFDIAALELFLPLIVGARLVVGRDVLFDPERSRAAVRERPTLLQATPSAWRQLLAEDFALPPTMKALCGGEALPADLAAMLARRFTAVWNVYGPTETTIWSAADRLGPEDVSVSLGHPIANTQLYVLGDDLEPLPLGAPGELYIGGDGVTRGYLRRPGLTAQQFVPDPFAAVPGARMYRTGDLATRGHDGRIQFLGRIDHQVKLRGHRIELAEVESAISAYPGVRNAVVVLHEDPPGERWLAGYVVPAQRDGVTPSELREHLVARLPGYMVPSAFVLLEALPLTPSGKVDRRALPAPGRDRQEPDHAPAGPRDELERQLVRLWGETLRLDQVGIHDDFFELGGDSLLALRLLTQVRQELRTELQAAVLFEQGTVAAMAEAMRTRSEPRTGPMVCLQPEGAAPPLLCAHPLGGHVFCYRELAGHFAASGHPFYAFQAAGLELGEPLASIEEMAAHYIEAARGLWPDGPRLLIGWCMGGVIAFEMARQLSAAGERVDLVAIISSNANEPVPDAYARDDISLLLDVVYGGRLGISHQQLQEIPPDQRLHAAFEASRHATDVRQDIVEEEQLERVVRLYRVNAKASLSYRPDPYPGDVVLYPPSQGHQGASHDLGWAPLVSGTLSIETVEGTHYTLLNGDNGAALAKRLLARIERPTAPAASQPAERMRVSADG
jgi:amino acid adenylation domain-containing protein